MSFDELDTLTDDRSEEELVQEVEKKSASEENQSEPKAERNQKRA